MVRRNAGGLRSSLTSELGDNGRADKWFEVYRIRPGDSLWRIARGLAGPGATDAQILRVEQLLWALNRHRIASGDPNVVTTADVILLPAREELS